MDIKEILSRQISEYNTNPLDDFQGFSPDQMTRILYQTFEKDCPIKINELDCNYLLEHCPILKIVVDLLKVLKNEKIKLTPKGNLPVKIIKDLYSKKYILDEYIESGITKLHSEEDWLAIHNSKIALLMSGLTNKKHNYLSVTKKCESLLEKEDYSAIFLEFFKVFATKFNWEYNDGYEIPRLGQFGVLYSLFLIRKFGDEKRNFSFYADLYFRAFPSFIEADTGSSLMICYQIRLITDLRNGSD